MDNLAFYIVIASLTIASPGPGVLLTLTNTINYSFARAFYGVLGVALGMGLIAVCAATSLGVLLISSPYALTIVKVTGAAYLLYMGTKLFKSVPKPLAGDRLVMVEPSRLRVFRDGLAITAFNPKPIVFFMALFPQFVDNIKPFLPQFTVLATVFCLLVVIIHTLYSLFAATVKRKLAGDTFFVWLNKCAGVAFVCFGVGLAVSAL